jgi:hypothetical protein
MSTWDVFFPDVMVHAIGAPDPLVRRALCRSAREFFGRTRAWRAWLSPITTAAGTGQGYDFVLPTESAIVRLERATLDGRPLDISNYTQEESDWTQFPEGEQSVVTRDLLTFNLRGSFGAGQKVQVNVSLTPTQLATGVPDHLANRYMEALADGAVAILLLTPDTDYFKPDLAAVAREKFKSAISSTALDMFHGNTNTVPRARPKWC